jgi:hypothetical protein
MRSKNEQTIRRAFSDFALYKHMRVLEGLEGLMRDAVMFIYEQHRVDGHENHLEYGDTFGWAIYYNGQLLKKKVNTGMEISDFSVSDELEARLANSKGYVGIVMAGMDPKTIFWYSHEEKYFEVAKDMIMAEFDRFFTEI